MAQNSETAARRRGPGRPFEPGRSGNPGGRPKGLAAKIRESVPPEHLAAHYLAIFHRDTAELKRLKIPLKDVTLAERNKAGEWLSDRGYGKAPQFVAIEGGDPLELSDVDRAIDEAVDELAAAREAKAARPPAARAVAGESPD